jgi:hypothetical protein
MYSFSLDAPEDVLPQCLQAAGFKMKSTLLQDEPLFFLHMVHQSDIRRRSQSMFTKLTPVSKDVMGKKCFVPLASYAFAAKEPVVPVGLSEFMRLFRYYPIVFAAREDDYIPMALLGLDATTNVWVDSRGRFMGGYIPAVFRTYPFVLARAGTGDEKGLTVCIDQEADVLADGGEKPLFDEKGEPSLFLSTMMHLLEKDNKQRVMAAWLGAELKKDGLFKECRLQIGRENSKTMTLQGLYRIDEAGLENLEEERFLFYKNKGFLPAIHAHFFSMLLFEILVKRTSGPKNHGDGAQQPEQVLPDAIPDSFHFE